MNCNKILTYYAAGLIAAGAAIAGCSTAHDEPQPSRPERGALAVAVTDAGYAPADGTRAVDEGLLTRFTAGDCVGLYAVKGGVAIVENLCLTLDDGGAWTAQNPEPLYHRSGTAYYAYYPWRADMDGMTDVGAVTAEGFFAPLVSSWTPAMDQSKYASYAGSDLMTCTGTVGALQADGRYPLSLALTHRMSLAMVELPAKQYTTADGFTYSTPVKGAAFAWGGAECKPYRTDGVYRILYNPASAAEVTGSYWAGVANNTFSFTPNVAAGSCKTYRIDGGITDGGERAIRVGDFYYADGSILPTETAAAMAAGSAPSGCIGIVFQTDPSRISAAEKKLFADAGRTVHGVVMATRAREDEDGHNRYSWSIYSRDESVEDPAFPGYFIPNLMDPKDYIRGWELLNADINGYFNTEVIKVRYAADCAAGVYEAFRNAMNYATQVSGPPDNAFFTGWYLPSLGQWLDFVRNIGGIKLTTTDNIVGSYTGFEWHDLPEGNVEERLDAAMAAIPPEDKTVLVSERFYWWTSSSFALEDGAMIVLYKDSIYCRGERSASKYHIRAAFAF